jgi:hypothetical protein
MDVIIDNSPRMIEQRRIADSISIIDFVAMVNTKMHRLADSIEIARQFRR